MPLAAAPRRGHAEEETSLRADTELEELRAEIGNQVEASDAAEEKEYGDDQIGKTMERNQELEEDITTLVLKIDKIAFTSDAEVDVKELRGTIGSGPDDAIASGALAEDAIGHVPECAKYRDNHDIAAQSWQLWP